MDRARLVSIWRTFGERECRGYSPLYETICEAVAENEAVLDLVLAAPRWGRQPNVLLAAAHYLVLGGVDHPLAAVYEQADDPTATADAGETFCDLVLANEEAVVDLLATRRTNTNECGRSAVLVPALRWFANRTSEPIALLDAGASAGLNLHLDRYLLDYGETGTTGPPDSPVRIACVLSGGAPIASTAPVIAARVGLDRAPVDLDDEREVRWLLACVWPDTGRLPRTAAAIEIARRERVHVVEGDLVDDLEATARSHLPTDLALAITTSWVMAYVPEGDHTSVEHAIARLSADRPVAWISAEGPDVLQAVAAVDAARDPGDTRSTLALTLFERGRATGTHLLGRCHPHGAALEWLAG